jgi:hypothetical protein
MRNTPADRHGGGEGAEAGKRGGSEHHDGVCARHRIAACSMRRKRAPSAATARSPPARAAALLIPDAVPLFSSGAESNTVVVSGAMLIVMPMATTISPGRKPLQ